METNDLVIETLNRWGLGIVAIGNAFLRSSDYELEARNFVDDLYNFESGPVLFKPTAAKEQPFRLDREAALSYFIGGNSQYSEDHGFALRPWNEIQFEHKQTVQFDDMILAMGRYNFIDTEKKVVRADYSFGFQKRNQKLKIVLHHSSFAN